ncbi:ATP-binding cassette sub-family C member 4-like isoform X2 [Homalodisca vitripennis]|uniref:ATP-binding cassette sub-family C member 4-like isoform X2 n=1 Tax=Homalodisca vitripennis TaxID=197043 RepID=UPI001EEA377B|nr:ATP-binding cassette sub-family C member 4-like isoform X2 [Homalodisca vitripennis]
MESHQPYSQRNWKAIGGCKDFFSKSQHSHKQKKREKRNKNPRDGTNLLSIFCYWWLVGLFRKGKKKELQPEDIYDVLDGLESNQLGERLERGWTNELLFSMDTSREPRVTKAIWFAFGASFVILTASLLFVEALYICQGMVLYWYVLSSVSQEYLLSLSVSSALSIMLHHGWNAIAMTVGTQLRISCHSLLCKKLLKLDANYNRVKDINEKMGQVTEGLVLAELAMVKAPYILIGPFYALFVLIVLWVYFDRTAVVGVVTLLAVLIPLLVMSRELAGRILSQCLPAKRERLFLLEEAATGMFQIKQRSLTEVVQNKISSVRRKEGVAMGYNAVLHTMVASIQAHGPNIMILLSVTVYTLAQQTFSEEDAFLILCLVQTLANPLCINLPMGFSLLTKLTSTIQVLQELLVMVDCPEVGKYDSELPADLRISLAGATAECFSNGPITLSKISFDVKEGQILSVVGPWRAGKTPLLYLLQGEIDACSGTVGIRGRTVFCPHTPWLLPAASVRDNVICGKHINDQRLKLVLEVCGLVRDIQELPKGDMTIIGTDDGVSLSLQQISKINLARTLYHECDIYLLDDPFRWLGRQVSDRIFTRCILRLLKDKTVILVTDKHRHIVKSDQIIALKNGKVEGYGKFEELVTTIASLEESSDLTSDDLDTDNEDSDMDEPSNTSTNNKLNIVECSYKYCRRYSYYPQPQSPVMKTASTVGTKGTGTPQDSQEDVVVRPSLTAVLRVVAGSCSKVGLALTAIGLLLAQGLLTTWDYCFIVGLSNNSSSMWDHWLKIPLNEEDTPLPALWYLSTGAVLTGVAVNYNVSLMLNRAANCIHDCLVKSFLHSPITILDQQILNKIFSCLSQDVRVLDEFLVPAFLNLSQHCLLLIGCLGLVVMAYQWFIIPTLLLVAFTFYLFSLCLPTTKALEIIETKLWRPVEAYFQLSEDEIVTLRSLKASDFYRRQFAEHQDRHSSALFLLQSVTEALSLWLSLACVAFTTCITLVFYFMEEPRPVVALGTYSCLMVTNLLPFLVADSTLASRLVETVRHMVQACQLPEETSDSSQVGTINPVFSGDVDFPVVSEGWPYSGEIQAINLTLTNKPGTHATLENLNFVIKPRETVGIVGSGKSSLLAALLRLEEPSGGGCVLIDKVDTRDVSVKLLRSKISVIPRHPIFFAGVLRTNLDPHDQISDSALWEAIEKVGLLEAVSSLPFGLLTESRHWDKTFSAAQRQLLHLALAIIAANRILIIDLTSRNTLPESDKSLVNLVRKLLPSSTVIIMSERLRLVMGTDRVLVLDSGKMAEYGHPYLILQNKHSHLNKMIQDAGPLELHNELFDIAKQAYMSEHTAVIIREESIESVDTAIHI